MDRLALAERPTSSSRGTIARAAPSRIAAATSGSARKLSADRGCGNSSPPAIASLAHSRTAPTALRSASSVVLPPEVHPGRLGMVTPHAPGLPSSKATYRAAVCLVLLTGPSGYFCDYPRHADGQGPVPGDDNSAGRLKTLCLPGLPSCPSLARQGLGTIRFRDTHIFTHSNPSTRRVVSSQDLHGCHDYRFPRDTASFTSRRANPHSLFHPGEP